MITANATRSSISDQRPNRPVSTFSETDSSVLILDTRASPCSSHKTSRESRTRERTGSRYCSTDLYLFSICVGVIMQRVTKNFEDYLVSLSSWPDVIGVRASGLEVVAGGSAVRSSLLVFHTVYKIREPRYILVGSAVESAGA